MHVAAAAAAAIAAVGGRVGLRRAGGCGVRRRPSVDGSPRGDAAIVCHKHSGLEAEGEAGGEGLFSKVRPLCELVFVLERGFVACVLFLFCLLCFLLFCCDFKKRNDEDRWMMMNDDIY